MVLFSSTCFSKTHKAQNSCLERKGSGKSFQSPDILTVLGASALLCLTKGRLQLRRALAQVPVRKLLLKPLKVGLPLSTLFVAKMSLPLAYSAPIKSAGASEFIDSVKQELYEETSKWVADVYDYESARRSIELVKGALYQFHKWECVDGEWQLRAEIAKEKHLLSIDELLIGISAESFMDFMDFSYAKLNQDNPDLKEHLITCEQLNHLYYFSGNANYRIYKITMIRRLFNQLKQCDNLAKETDILIQSSALKA
ncbi:MAG: hypothetical protein GWP59_01935 [Chlamydiales bacterium]|nr:hypothetical protein [Chlamydiales bacterium]NCF70439.1 hypothetical protein [Chlamydiales bacterium]